MTMRVSLSAQEFYSPEGMGTEVLHLLMGILGIPSVVDLAACTREWSRVGSPEMAAKYARKTYHLAARMHPRWWREWQASANSESASRLGRAA